ncbi:hypothetical protein C882_2823 [Caenispirillum salinarum AK4]|uniref:DUF4399 domain-containing protein n=1 Tax=Caenispirillum salinarum AK4 TaxID=1238182 RepID=K9H6Z5_9PROT|nr:DUF4399 domain-containing protein [Caenispirillum salinarum]EKV26388.1 hypothetical protein C882_2823 [Caenispirillum salinarum AK4]
MFRHPVHGLGAALCALGLAIAVPAASALAQEDAPKLTPAPENAYLYIGWPNDGERVRSPFKVWFGLRGMGVAPKGVAHENTGHHHLLINSDLPPAGEPLPADRNTLHFGAGETETRLDLPPGRYTLQLVMGDHDHVMHDPPIVSRKITVTVR